jgi:hypothetical protein
VNHRVADRATSSFTAPSLPGCPLLGHQIMTRTPGHVLK